ncbi:MAG TPA: hypothetical protein VL633_08055 [Bacteroidota bacterium]|jgi:hypothetical protein|nr:hypothetical protein [Bacteroidota bacterium]
MNPKPDKVIPALYGGIIMALVSTIPFLAFINCLCCAGIMLGGLLSVFFYKNNFTPDTPPITAGECMIVGLIAGNIGAVVGSFLSLLFMKLFGPVMINAIVDFLHQLNVQLTQDQWNALDKAREGNTGAFSFVLGMIGNIFIYGVFGLVGGLIGYSLFKPKGPQSMPPPPHHEMPPPPGY